MPESGLRLEVTVTAVFAAQNCIRLGLATWQTPELSSLGGLQIRDTAEFNSALRMTANFRVRLRQRGN